MAIFLSFKRRYPSSDYTVENRDFPDILYILTSQLSIPRNEKIGTVIWNRYIITYMSLSVAAGIAQCQGTLVGVVAPLSRKGTYCVKSGRRAEANCKVLRSRTTVIDGLDFLPLTADPELYFPISLGSSAVVTLSLQCQGYLPTLVHWSYSLQYPTIAPIAQLSRFRRPSGRDGLQANFLAYFLLILCNKRLFPSLRGISIKAAKSVAHPECQKNRSNNHKPFQPRFSRRVSSLLVRTAEVTVTRSIRNTAPALIAKHVHYLPFAKQHYS